jgi:hypothetical protein
MKLRLKKAMQRINEAKCVALAKINRIDKHSTKLTKRRKEIQINKIRNEKGNTKQI